jgi:uncharacterized protein YdeI (YjbR/CyaY-like superfamily)
MPARKDARVDAYIREAGSFAKPILKHLRMVVHKACPKAQETLKWSAPFFMYEGKPLCMMAAFKAHCSFGFWKGSLIIKADGKKANIGMGQLGKITTLKDLPSDRELASYVKLAMIYNEPGGPKIKRPLKHPKPPVKPPADFIRALKANARAFAAFNEFSPSRKRDYVEWITSAKSDETRERRLETAVDWISEGKSRNWKYEK